jgi:DNA-binding transcriptional MerR regulator
MQRELRTYRCVRKLVMGIKIGQLARATGTTAPTIRYYEQIGLLPLPSRTGGQRRYDEADVRRLTFIRRCRDFGFSIEQVRKLATLIHNSERSCSEARELAEAHLAAVRKELRELCGLEHSIVSFIETTNDSCLGGPGADCVVLEELANPAEIMASR